MYSIWATAQKKMSLFCDTKVKWEELGLPQGRLRRMELGDAPNP